MITDKQVEAACAKFHGHSWNEYSDYARRLGMEQMRGVLVEFAKSVSGAPGFVLVPHEPTEAMIDAAQSNATGGLMTREARSAVFRAMIAAAPGAQKTDECVEALRMISRNGCENYTDGSCRDVGSGRTRGAQYSADAWCDACVAMSALTLTALQGKS